MVTRRTADNTAPPAASLAALADAADQLGGDDTAGAAHHDQAQPPHQAEPEQSRAESNAFRLGVLLRLLRDLTAEPALLDPPIKALQAGLPDDKVDLVANAWGRALDEMGVDFMGGMDLMDHPAARAAMVTAPILWPVGRALWLELRNRRPVDVDASTGPADKTAPQDQASGD